MHEKLGALVAKVLTEKKLLSKLSSNNNSIIIANILLQGVSLTPNQHYYMN